MFIRRPSTFAAAAVVASLLGPADAVSLPRAAGWGTGTVPAPAGWGGWREDRRPGTPGQARRVVQEMTTGSLRFQADLKRCGAERPGLDCIGGALVDYADWLDRVERTPNSVLPVAVPAVRRAGTSVRRAGSPTAARTAVAEAASAVRKSLDLVRAGTDDTVRRLEIAQRSIVLESLAAADLALVRAVGI